MQSLSWVVLLVLLGAPTWADDLVVHFDVQPPGLEIREVNPPRGVIGYSGTNPVKVFLPPNASGNTRIAFELADRGRRVDGFEVRVNNLRDDKLPAIRENDTRPAARTPLLIVLGAVGLLIAALIPLWIRRQREVEKKLAMAAAVAAAADPNAVRSMPALTGHTVTTEQNRQYTVLAELGRGGHGAVYEAADADMTKVAIKFLYADAIQDVARFRREIAICAGLFHPGIVQVLDWGEEPTPFMVMERVEGRDLHSVMRQSPGPIPTEQAVAWMEEILQALAIAHSAGIVHRDLKPSNLMVTPHGHIKIMDFGIARRLGHHTLTKTGDTMGTPLYMSPEHLDAKAVTPASDLYSVGVLTYEMLTRTTPHDNGEQDQDWMVMAARLIKPPRPITEHCPDLPKPLADVVMRLLEREPARRYATCQDVLSALR